ncbi:MAG: hypothetical protein ACLQVA_13550 [Candidatus Brocadiia bacterium]
MDDLQSQGCLGDFGSSFCSEIINDLLSVRVIHQWQQPDTAPGCIGCLSLQQALARIATRQGLAVAGDVLAHAVATGMPWSQAVALAAENGISLDRAIPTLPERFMEASKQAQARLQLQKCAPCKQKMLAEMKAEMRSERQ